MNDADLIRIARLHNDIEAFIDVPELSSSGGDPMKHVEARLKEIGNELRTKIEPMARRAYTAARDMITAPDYEPGAGPNTTVLRRMVAWLEAEDDDE